MRQSLVQIRAKDFKIHKIKETGLLHYSLAPINVGKMKSHKNTQNQTVFRTLQFYRQKIASLHESLQNAASVRQTIEAIAL